MNVLSIMLAAAVTTAQMSSLRDSSTVVTGVDAGAFLASSNNTYSAGRTNLLFSGGTVRSSGTAFVVDGGGLALKPGTPLVIEGPVYLPTNALASASIPGWESLDQRMDRKLVGLYYYDTDRYGNRTAITQGARDPSYPVGPWSVSIGPFASASGYYALAGGMDSLASGASSLAYGTAARATADDAYAIGYAPVSSNQYAFTWNGRTGYFYGSHGRGTFNIFPAAGVDGFWIGEQTLADYVTSRVSGFANPSYPFTFRAALGDSGIQFSTLAGGNRQVFTGGTALVMQDGSTLVVSSNATLAVARPWDVTVGGTALDSWVASLAASANEGAVKAVVESETGGTNAVRAAASFAALNATKWTGEGSAAGMVLLRDPVEGRWTDGTNYIVWSDISTWNYYGTNGTGSASGGLTAGRIVFDGIDGDFAFVASPDGRGDFVRATDVAALAPPPGNYLAVSNAALASQSLEAARTGFGEWRAPTNATYELVEMIIDGGWCAVRFRLDGSATVYDAMPKPYQDDMTNFTFNAGLPPLVRDRFPTMADLGGFAKASDLEGVAHASDLAGVVTAAVVTNVVRSVVAMTSDYVWDAQAECLFRRSMENQYLYWTPVTNVNALLPENAEVLEYLEAHKND